MSNNKVVKLLVNLDFVVAGACLCVLVAITFMGVIRRYFLGNPITWLEEVQVWLFLWITFFGGAACFRLKSHVAIEILVDILPRTLQKVVSVLIYGVVIAVITYLFFKSNLMIQQFIDTSQVTNVLRIPTYFVYAAMPIGCALMIVNHTAVVVIDLLTTKKELEEGESA